jgi:hypothetical protein
LIFSEPMRGMSMVKPGVLVSFPDGSEFPVLLPIGSSSLQELCELFPANCAQHSFPLAAYKTSSRTIVRATSLAKFSYFL